MGTEMTFTINNGRRADVSFGTYKGRAGISEDWTEVAFPARLRDFRDPLGSGLKLVGGAIEGREFTVTDARQSGEWVILTVAAVTPGDPA